MTVTTIASPTARTVVPNNLSTWRWLHRLRTLPLPLAHQNDLSAVEDWINAIYVPTTRDKTVAAQIAHTTSRTVGTKRRWLAINGIPDLGKTELIVNYAIHRMDRPGEPPQRLNGHLQLPVLYAEANSGSGSQGAALLEAICAFAGITPAGGEVKTRNQLQYLLPLMGTTQIIVDDINMHRRANPKATRLPDSWRANLRLPVTFVCVGAGVDRSALLDMGNGGDLYQVTQQLASRHDPLHLKPLVLPADDAELKALVGGFAARVRAGIPGTTFSVLSKKAVVDELSGRCKHRHGKIVGVLKEATSVAVRSASRDVSPDLVAAFWDPW